MSRNPYIEKIETLTNKKLSITLDFTNEINLIDNEMQKMVEQMKKFELDKEIENQFDLTKSKDVVMFLGISRQTLKTLREKGRLENGVHYTFSNDRITYIPQGIIEFEKKYQKYQKRILKSNNINAFEQFELRNLRKAS